MGYSGAAGSIRVYNAGGYVARFSIGFKLHGEYIAHGSGNFPAAQSRYLEIPKAATDITLFVDNLIFIGTF